MARTALLSVSDKTGLLTFARFLVSQDVRLLSSGGTAQALAEAGIPVETVENYTESPEVMGGRVKTLHPRVHGGILARADVDAADLARIGGRLIDFVIVNLYPFERVATDPSSSKAKIIETIDIGGPSMLRSAAKNNARVAVICDPSDYDGIREEMRQGELTATTRLRLAAKAFAHTHAYDGMIARTLGAWTTSQELEGFPPSLALSFERTSTLRYGENPHQGAAVYVERDARPGSLARASNVGAGGKELSFNNLVDAEAALDAVREFDVPAAVVVKHTNPCGVATALDLTQAFRMARDADAVSAFGGIVAVNREVDEAAAAVLAETFLECVVAPSFTEGALAVLHAKKNLRLLATGAWLEASHQAFETKRIGGGLLVQSRDASGPGEVSKGRVVTARIPTAYEVECLEFAWRVAKHVKSNAIVLAKENRTVGVGAGQMSRVVSVEIACNKAGAAARGSVLASDAFFPFPDGLEAAAKAGIVAVAQPGGSVKDADVIAAADAHDIAMIFTGIRHFRH